MRSPQRFIGVHFFNPVALMPLVEIVRCDDTEQTAIDIGLAFVKGIGKFPLECASSPGFVVNRLLAPYMTEAMHLVESGVDRHTIDNILRHFLRLPLVLMPAHAEYPLTRLGGIHRLCYLGDYVAETARPGKIQHLLCTAVA